MSAAARGLITGRVLDAGCGTGELSLFLASGGREVLGVDASPTAVERARENARRRGVEASFRVADVLALPDIGTFDTVVDSGLLHVFDDARERYLASLAGVLRPGGRYLALTFAPGAPAGGPRRLSRETLRTAFGPEWTVESLTETTFETTMGAGHVPAYLTVARRA